MSKFWRNITFFFFGVAALGVLYSTSAILPKDSQALTYTTSAVSSGALGSVQFSDGATGFSSNNAKLHWDSVNNILEIGTLNNATNAGTVFHVGTSDIEMDPTYGIQVNSNIVFQDDKVTNDKLIFSTGYSNLEIRSVAAGTTYLKGDLFGLSSKAWPTDGLGARFIMAVSGGNPTGIGANTAGLFVKDVAASGELFAFDEAGNVTQLSTHDAMTGNYILKSENVYSGKTISIDMERLAREVEILSGKTLIQEGILPAEEIQDWDQNETNLKERRRVQRKAWQDEKDRRKDLSQQEQDRLPDLGEKPDIWKDRNKPPFLG